MEEMMKAGKLRMEQKKVKYRVRGKDHILEDDIAAAVNFVLFAKDWIGEAMKFSPEASLIWAGVSTVLPLLTNPSISAKANSDGFAYVTSRLRYYVALESLLLPQNQETGISYDWRKEFEKHIETLYQEILKFQLRSIIRFYKSRLGILVADAFHLEWDKMILTIKDLEDIVYKESVQINTAESVADLREISKHTEGMLSRMDEQLSVTKDQLSVAKDQLEVTKAIAAFKMTKDESACLQLFRLVDTNQTGYEWYKNQVQERVEGTCQWFLNHKKFQ
jgi:hypothetical protein